MSGNALRQTLLALTDANVCFVICGGVACILQGVARATHDLDIRVALRQDDLARLVGVARRLDLRPRIPEPLDALLDPARREAWVTEKHAVVYTLLAASGAFSVDVFLQYPLTYEELAQSADRVVVDGRTLLVSSKQHLVQAKRAVQPPRKQDLRDIEDLLELLDAE